MAKYYVRKGQETKYIKDIDFANGKLTFTKKSEEAYNGRDGYYATPLKDQIKRLFVEDYPEVAELQCSSSY